MGGETCLRGRPMTLDEYEALPDWIKDRIGPYGDWPDAPNLDLDDEMAQVDTRPVGERGEAKKKVGPSKSKTGHAHIAHALKHLGVRVGISEDDKLLKD